MSPLLELNGVGELSDHSHQHCVTARAACGSLPLSAQLSAPWLQYANEHVGQPLPPIVAFFRIVIVDFSAERILVALPCP